MTVTKMAQVHNDLLSKYSEGLLSDIDFALSMRDMYSKYIEDEKKKCEDRLNSINS